MAVSRGKQYELMEYGLHCLYVIRKILWKRMKRLVLMQLLSTHLILTQLYHGLNRQIKAYPDFEVAILIIWYTDLNLLQEISFSIKDYWNIDITFAVSHFHDVCISKEGHTDGMKMLIDIKIS